MSRNTLLIFDADNTIWDTNSIFLDAQLAMLKPFQDSGYISDPNQEISILRKIDQALAKELSNFEYNPLILSRALSSHFVDKLPINESVSSALNNAIPSLQTNDVINNSYQNYLQYINKTPTLLKGVSEFLVRLDSQNRRNIATVMYSEGQAMRIHSIYKSHNLDLNRYFDEIVINVKNTENFVKAKQVGLKHLPDKDDCRVIVIGDSLKRDIIPANSAGFTTIYIPAGYQGRETPSLPYEKPDFQISSFYDLPQCLRELEIYI